MKKRNRNFKPFRKINFIFPFIMFVSIVLGTLLSMLIYEKLIFGRLAFTFPELPDSYYYELKSELEEDINLKGFQNTLDSFGQKYQSNIYLVNPEGKTLLKSKYSDPLKLSLVEVDQYIEAFWIPNNYNHSYFYKKPITLNENSFYLIIETKGEINVKGWNTAVMILVLLIPTTVITLYYLLTQKKMKQLSRIFQGIERMKKQDKKGKIEVLTQDQFGDLAISINEMYEELIASKEEAVQVEKQKNELITNMSHDLRTPLTTLIGYLQLLELMELKDEEANKYVKNSFEQANKVKKLTDDLFSLAKLNSGSQQANLYPIDLNLLVNQIVNEFTPVLKEGVTLEIQNAEIPIQVNVDPLLMTRMMENLIINAIKHGEEPNRVILSVMQEDEVAILEVSNPCKPISNDDMSQLFERTFIVDKARSKGDSSGLGLAIVKSIVQLHKGNISAHQKNNRIYFTIRIPK